MGDSGSIWRFVFIPLKRMTTNSSQISRCRYCRNFSTRFSLDLKSPSQTFSAVESFLLAMYTHPEIQERAYAELLKVVGPSRLPRFSDRGDLPYIGAIIKEVSCWVFGFIVQRNKEVTCF